MTKHDPYRAITIAGTTSTEQRFISTLQTIMSAFKLTQSDLADLLALEQAAISRKMSGARKTSFNLKEIDLLASRFHVPVSMLLFPEDRADLVDLIDRGPFGRNLIAERAR